MFNLDPNDLKMFGGAALALAGLFLFSDKGSAVGSSIISRIQSLLSGGSSPSSVAEITTDEQVLHCALELGKYFDSKKDIDGKKYASRIGTYVFERYLTPSNPIAPITQ